MKLKILPSMTTTKNLTRTKFKSALGIAGQRLSRAECLGAVILLCSGASAQNLLVPGSNAGGGEIWIREAALLPTASFPFSDLQSHN